MMLVELHVKEYEKSHVKFLRKRKHIDNHQIKEHKHIDDEVFPMWVSL